MREHALIDIAIGLARTMDPEVIRRVNGLCNAYVLLVPLAAVGHERGAGPDENDWAAMLRATQARIRYFIQSGRLAGFDSPCPGPVRHTGKRTLMTKPIDSAFE